MKALFQNANLLSQIANVPNPPPPNDKQHNKPKPSRPLLRSKQLTPGRHWQRETSKRGYSQMKNAGIKDLWSRYNALEQNLMEIAISNSVSIERLKECAKELGLPTHMKVMHLLKSQLNVLIEIKNRELRDVCSQPVVDLTSFRLHFGRKSP